ncbi:flagellin [Halarcobacter sp.]|uniref:flagellin n=1 Tax=Halarcobacter sp. TaxID=2321133 RepID=UPI002AA84079|nr:flagellin [Halarcobacter sp.]
MDVNSIENGLVSLNNTPQKINKKSDTSVVHNDKEDSFSLYIKDYNKKRDELSSSLQAFNEGIAITKIAIRGLEKEQNSLRDIEISLSLNNEYNDKNNIKKSILEELQNFKEIAYDTKYKREKLIAVDDFEENLRIEIFTKESYFSIEKPNTPIIASLVTQNINKSDLNNQASLDKLILSVEKAINELKNIESQFDELHNNLVQSAKKSIQDQVNLSNQNKRKKSIDFTEEVNNFSKDKVKANSGYLVTSQANIVQDQSVDLLS